MRDTIVIGLVNNMPGAALAATERQFRTLLAAAAGDSAVELRLFWLPGVPRGAETRGYLDRHYRDIAALRQSPVDALIVTGAEPRAPCLTEEPYWEALAGLVDWAEHRTVSTIWSCLAAHAAVLHRDGIRRQPFSRKLVGVFDCVRRSEHPLTAGLPRAWPVPHSRCNGLSQTALRAKGYRLLSSSEQGGVDTFLRDGDSLFVFLQGHPEYDAGALYREYRRDVGRFLAGERDSYPDLPRHYFGAAATAEYAAFRDRAVAGGALTLDDFPAAAPAPVWGEPARRFYANWLGEVAARRSGKASGAIPVMAAAAP